MRQLSRQAVKSIVENHETLAREFPTGSSKSAVLLQVVTLDILEGERAAKIKARMQLSDGVSQIHCMVSPKVWNQLEGLNLYDVVSFEPTKAKIQFVKEVPTIVLQQKNLELVATNIASVIGAPCSIKTNLSSDSFPDHYDTRIPPSASLIGCENAEDVKMSAFEQESPSVLNNAMDKMQVKSTEQITQDERDFCPPVCGNTGKVVSEFIKDAPETGSNFYMPISALNSYSTDWIIKARIIKRAQLRTYKNAKGEGKILNIDIKDRDGTMIQATLFNKEVDKWSDMLVENEVFTFSSGQIKLANKRFTSIKNDYCITFDSSTTINKVQNDHSITQDGFQFTPISNLADLAANATIDVLGVVFDMSPVQTINMKNGQQRAKKELKIIDETNSSISVTIWGDACHQHNFQIGQVAAFKACRLSDYGGRSLNASSAARDIFVGMNDNKKAQQLLQWYSKNGHQENRQLTETRERNNGEYGTQQTNQTSMKDMFYSISEMTCAAENDEEIANKARFYQVRGQVTHISYEGKNSEEQRSFYYLACPSCKKKVHEDNGTYRCESCCQNYENCNPTYKFSFKFQDYSDSIYLSCLGESCGDAIMGMPCAELYQMEDQALRREMIQQNYFNEFSLLIRVTAQDQRGNYGNLDDYMMGGDKPNLKYHLVKILPQGIKESNASLLKKLEIYANK